MTIFGNDRPGHLSPGTEVEVRTRYQGRWVPGFEVDAVHSDPRESNDRYVLRRRSDGAVLPVAFNQTEVRPRR
jgi:hypothetical protein